MIRLIVEGEYFENLNAARSRKVGIDVNLAELQQLDVRALLI